jgi:hypothetical protein
MVDFLGVAIEYYAVSMMVMCYIPLWSTADERLCYVSNILNGRFSIKFLRTENDRENLFVCFCALCGKNY